MTQPFLGADSLVAGGGGGGTNRHGWGMVKKRPWQHCASPPRAHFFLHILLCDLPPVLRKHAASQESDGQTGSCA